jgi:phage shock protein A
MGLWDKIKSFFGATPAPISVEQRVESEIAADEKRLKDFERKIADVIARKKTLAEQSALAEHDAQKWTAIAEAAAATSKEENVRSAARQKLEAEQKRDRIKSELSTLEKTLDGLNEQLKAAQDKIDCERADQATLTARLESAKLRQNLAGDGSSAANSLRELENSVAENETKAETSEELSRFQQDVSSNKKVDNDDVEAEVKRLMQRKRTQ